MCERGQDLRACPHAAGFGPQTLVDAALVVKYGSWIEKGVSGLA